MFTVVPSRFAGLKVEDDDDGFRKPKQKSKSATSSKPKTTSVKNTTTQPTAQQPTKKPKAKPQKSKPSNETLQKEQWSEWQQKDTELVEKSYVNDLEQALLLSKLDFEANKSKYSQLEKESKQSAMKDKKPKALSLQEFQEKVSKELNDRQQQKKRQQDEAEYNRNYTFFEQIDLETKQILNKEQLKQLLKQNSSMSSKTKESPKKDISPAAEPSVSELDLLKVENLNLKEEIAVLRDRYKKVVTMLKNGEMKEKTELMIEIEKLRKVQEDMTAEMTALYGQLEQAKSRTNQDVKGREKPNNR
ncbi:G kinase-anchoring protein 1-like [Anopheles marshallii]|uniref:G kinase-anchoring protein 1-like n=1 Tax=Anopheles marshallii TaxID=1521116 RepID=UPI00237AF13E|nr:G kinase-anchoring protein 1-like [Anopheles marshallii]